MPRSTPAVEAHVYENDDVGLEVEEACFTSASNACVTGPRLPGVLIYPHGFSGRVTILLRGPEAAFALTGCGWSESPSKRVWKFSTLKNGVERWTLRGSAWLTGRAPSNGKLPFAGRNKLWNTRLYSLAIERKGDAFTVDLQGVRFQDIRKFFSEVLGLDEAHYQIDYYRRAERFLVLMPFEAMRLAARLGTTPKRGRGRLNRKTFLVKDYPLPEVTVRGWAKATPLLTVYRIERGATALYKVEIALTGKRNNRGQFHEKDIETLDRLLLDLIAEHDLHPVAKPSRWEPRTFNTAAERGGFDPLMQRIAQPAWLGTKLSEARIRLVERCHTVGLVNLVDFDGDTGTYPATSRVRAAILPSPAHEPGSPPGQMPRWKCVEGAGFSPKRYVNEAEALEAPLPATRGPYEAIAREVGLLPGSFSEVVLDDEQDPTPLLDALVAEEIGPVRVSALCAVFPNGEADTWDSALVQMKQNPPLEETAVWVLVVDTSAFLAVSDAVSVLNERMFDSPEEPTCHDGPLVNPAWANPYGYHESLQVKAMAAYLWEMFEGFRKVCESTGLRVVVVTTDARPDHGRGPWLNTHYYRDGRVRSFSGDAGRYWCSQRYMVEYDRYTIRLPGREERMEDDAEGEPCFRITEARVEHRRYVSRVVCAKDLADGQPGRRVCGKSFT
jgi:hypothetical protein